MKETAIAIQIETDLSFGDAVTRCREGLAGEGFGVLCEIDIQATLKKKLDADLDPYLILGACHPPSALRAVASRAEVGVMLPCNITVSVEEGRTVVRAMRPEAALGLLDSEEIAEVAVEVGGALRRVLASLDGESQQTG